VEFVPGVSRVGDEWELMTVMSNDVFKPETEKDEIPPASPEEFLEALERADAYPAVSVESALLAPECRLVVHTDPRSAGADRFRLVQIRLRSIQASRKLQSLLITSPLPEEGKSTVALNLATGLAEKGKYPVLLLEADVHRPTILKKLGLEPWFGLTECFQSNRDPMQAIRRIDPLGFYLLPAGQPTEDGSSLLQSDFTSQLIKNLSTSSFSWILIDSPPTTPIADILVLRAQADATLLVARARQTPREAIEESTQNLGRGHVLGILLNGVEGLDRAYSKYYGYAGSHSRVKNMMGKVGTSAKLIESNVERRLRQAVSKVKENLGRRKDGE
jgi:capsular exopolysaccharide synthesis family protein